jgi:hypothetical protein
MEKDIKKLEFQIVELHAKLNNQEKKIVKKLKGVKTRTIFYWVSGFSCLFSIVAICGVFVCKNTIVEKESIVLTFIGILATFMVISNYIQVNAMQKELNFIRYDLNKSIVDTKGELASLVHYVNAVRYEQMKNVFKKYDLSAVIFDCYISAMSCLSDISNVETKTINPLLSGISKIIDCTDVQSIVKNYVNININKNSSCIDLLQRFNIKGGDKNKVIKFIKDVNEIAEKEGKASWDDYEYV